MDPTTIIAIIIAVIITIALYCFSCAAKNKKRKWRNIPFKRS